MDDDMDDFGDLYGDLDCRMSEKMEGGKVESKAVGVDPVVDESESNAKAAAFDAKEMLNLDGENSDEDSESEDDDDFRIVLNENKFGRTRKMGIGGIDEEDEFDGVGDRLNNDQSESMPGSEARGVSMSAAHRPNRNVGSHLGGFPSSARASVSGRDEWDNPLAPCFQGSASYNRDISAAVQSGGTFCLPRNRTIFDINIEVFEQKPWRHHEANITDYFNFGLDEESWKSYCEALDQFRKQVVMLSSSPVYPMSWLNQGGRNSSVLESLEKGGREFDMPKGRAIQVEGGIYGERVPSTDIRRPRLLDPDVVIHINMEGSVEDPSALCKDSSEHTEEHLDALLPTSGSNLKERVLCPDHEGQTGRHITNLIENCSPGLNGCNLSATSGKVKSNTDCKREDEKDLFRTDAIFDLGSGSGEQAPHISSSCNLQSHSEESKDVFCHGKDTKHNRKASVVELQDSIESDYYLSYDSISYATESEHEDSKDVARKRDLSSGGYRHFSRARLRNVGELNVAGDDELTSNVIHMKHQNNLNLADMTCKTRKRKSCHHTDDIKGHLHSHPETEVSLSYKSRTHASRDGTEYFFTKYSRKDNCGPCPSRNWDEKDCVEQRECYFSGRCHEAQGRRSSIRKYSDQLVSKKSFFKKKDAGEREYEHWTGIDPEYDHSICGNRYRDQGIQDMRGTYVDIHNMEDESLDLNFRRCVYSSNTKIKSLERSRYDRASSFKRNQSSKSFKDDADYRLVSHRYEEPYNTNERDLHDTCSPREHLHSLWRSNGRYMNHRVHPDIGHLQLKNGKCGRVVASNKDHHHFSYEGRLEFDIDEYVSEGNAYSEDFVSSVHMRRHSQLSKSNLHADDGARFRHCEQGGLPSPERFLLRKSLKHENCQVRQPFFHSRRLLGGHLLNSAGKMRVMGTSDSDARDHVNFVSDMGRHELAAVGCREAVNKHLNDLKGKGEHGKLANSTLPLNIKGKTGICQLGRTCPRGFAGESQKGIDIGYKDDQLRNSRQLKKDKKREIYPRILKGKGSQNFQTGLNVDKVKDSKSFTSDDRNKNLLDKPSVSQNSEDNEIEEGEVIEESRKQDVVSVKKDRISGKVVDNFQSKDSLLSVKVPGLYNKSCILETLAKMEKRLERFKEPTAPKQEPEKSVDPKVDVSVVSDEVKQQRPARKRHWGGN